MTYSEDDENLPRCILIPGFHHVTIFLHTHPPHCTASDIVGNCRQSVKTIATAPILDIRSNRLIHIVIHTKNERWSRLSPVNSDLSVEIESDCIYFEDGFLTLSPRNCPPLEYGGSTITASTVGKCGRISRQSPCRRRKRPSSEHHNALTTGRARRHSSTSAVMIEDVISNSRTAHGCSRSFSIASPYRMYCWEDHILHVLAVFHGSISDEWYCSLSQTRVPNPSVLAFYHQWR